MYFIHEVLSTTVLEQSSFMSLTLILPLFTIAIILIAIAGGCIMWRFATWVFTPNITPKPETTLILRAVQWCGWQIVHLTILTVLIIGLVIAFCIGGMIGEDADLTTR